MERPYGWFSEAEGQAYAGLVQNIRNGVIVEFGLYLGRSFSYILPVCAENNNLLFGIDDWRLHQHRTIRNTFFEWFRQSGFAATIIEQDGIESVKSFDDASIDLVMVDTNHHYEPTKEQVSIWLPKLKSGGIICGHDYNDTWPGLVQAVDEMLGKPQNLVDSFWWFQVDSL